MDEIHRQFELFCRKTTEGNSTEASLKKSELEDALAALGTPISEWDYEFPDPCNLQDFEAAALKARRLHTISSIMRNANLKRSIEPYLPSSVNEIMEMSSQKIREVVERSDLVAKFANEIWLSVQSQKGRSDTDKARSANAKFSSDGAMQATHGDDAIFKGGLENAVGLPDPRIMRAILHEHMFMPDSQDHFLTTNYQLWTSPETEMSFLLGRIDDVMLVAEIADGSSTSQRAAGVAALGPSAQEFVDLRGELQRLMSLDRARITAGRKYPGEIGDSYVDTVVLISMVDAPSTPSPDAALVAALLRALRDRLPREPGLIAAASCATAEVSARLARMDISIGTGVGASAGDDDGGRHVLVTLPLAEADLVAGWRGNLEGLCAEAAARIPGGPTGCRVISSSERAWQFAANPEGGVLQRPGRRRTPLRDIMAVPATTQAGLRVEEAVAVVAYTGPMFNKYNGVLRNVELGAGGRVLGFRDSGSRYTTTLHCITSAVVKLAGVTALPPRERRLWRGLGGMALNERLFFERDARGARGGVELAFMSTTASKAVAMQYSGQDRHRGIVLELDYDKVLCRGALP